VKSLLFTWWCIHLSMSVHTSKMDRSLLIKRENDKKSNHSNIKTKSIHWMLSAFSLSLSLFTNDKKMRSPTLINKFIFIGSIKKKTSQILKWKCLNFTYLIARYILLMICETIGSRPRQSICKYRLQDPCAKLHSFTLI
jgi:hypothetical protein